MTQPLISVVIPAFNNGRTLSRTMQSVLAQDVDGLEVIVADHASSDDTAAVAAQFAGDPRVTLLSTPSGGGVGRNWNRVTEAATGTYLKLLCGDDVLRPHSVHRQISLLEASGAVLTAARRDIVDASDRVVISSWGLRGLAQPMPGSEAVRRSVRSGGNQFGEPGAVTMVRSALVEAGGWCDRFPYLIDQATYSLVLLRGSFIPDDHTGAAFRLTATQLSVALGREQSRQARAFHAWLREMHPDVISAADRQVGDVRATIRAHARRLSYLVLRRRLR